MANSTPARSRPGSVEVAVALGAGGEHHARRRRAQLVGSARRGRRRRRSRSATPSAYSCSSRRSTSCLLELEVGDAVAQQAAGRGRRARTPSPRGPARASCWAAARPAGPEPTTATLRPRRHRRRGCGTTQPSCQRALDDRQLDLLDRHRVVVEREDARLLARRRAELAGELGEVVRRVQPVDAPRASGRGRTRSFQSGIRLPSGQPVWQNGTPQSMQRRACSRTRPASVGRRRCVAVVARAARDRAVRRTRRRMLQEAARVSHRPPPPRAARPRSRAPAAGRAAAPCTKRRQAASSQSASSARAPRRCRCSSRVALEQRAQDAPRRSARRPARGRPCRGCSAR